MNVTFCVPVCYAVARRLKECFQDDLAQQANEAFHKVYKTWPHTDVSVTQTERCDDYTDAMTRHAANHIETENVSRWLDLQWTRVTFQFLAAIDDFDTRTTHREKPCRRVLRDLLDKLLRNTVDEQLAYIGEGSRGQVLVLWVIPFLLLVATHTLRQTNGEAQVFKDKTVTVLRPTSYDCTDDAILLRSKGKTGLPFYVDSVADRSQLAVALDELTKPRALLTVSVTRTRGWFWLNTYYTIQPLDANLEPLGSPCTKTLSNADLTRLLDYVAMLEKHFEVSFLFFGLFFLVEPKFAACWQGLQKLVPRPCTARPQRARDRARIVPQTAQGRRLGGPFARINASFFRNLSEAKRISRRCRASGSSPRQTTEAWQSAPPCTSATCGYTTSCPGSVPGIFEGLSKLAKSSTSSSRSTLSGKGVRK